MLGELVGKTAEKFAAASENRFGKIPETLLMEHWGQRPDSFAPCVLVPLVRFLSVVSATRRRASNLKYSSRVQRSLARSLLGYSVKY